MELLSGGIYVSLVLGFFLSVALTIHHLRQRGKASQERRLWLLALASTTAIIFSALELSGVVSGESLSNFGTISSTAVAIVIGFSALAMIMTWPAAEAVHVDGADSDRHAHLGHGKYPTGMPLPSYGKSECRSLQSLPAGRQKPGDGDVEQLFAQALLGSAITISAQDHALRYIWIHNPPPGFSPTSILGKTDNQILPSKIAFPILEAKRAVLESGKEQQIETTIEIGGEKHFFDIRIKPLLDVHGQPEGIISTAIDNTERRHAEIQLRLMMREVNHRSKNLLSVVQAMARQTAAHIERPGDFVEIFTNRLQALAHAHDLLVNESWMGASLIDLIQSQIHHHLSSEQSQFDLEGDNVHLSVDATQHIGLAIHELATNAAKYGALSVPEGKVRVSWRRTGGQDETAMLELSWKESDGPAVTPPSRKGFGHVVFEKLAAQALDGEVKIEFAPEGLSWNIRIPWKHVVGQ
jgi:two-component sensor histidine kinase